MSVRLICYIQFILLIQSLLWTASASYPHKDCGKQDSDLEKAFKLDKIVPDVVSAYPEQFLDVLTEDNVELCFDEDIGQPDVTKVPQIAYEFTDYRPSYYTAAIVDPDSVSKPQFLHYLVMNMDDDVENGDTIMSYTPLTPTKGSGKHRYTVLLYRQPSKMEKKTVDRIKRTIERTGFNMEQFAKEHNLGTPIAGNYFKAQS